MREGEAVDHRSAAEVRASLLRAHRLYEARLLAGHEDEESVEAEAGAILEAETAVDLHRMRVIADAWFEAHKS